MPSNQAVAAATEIIGLITSLLSAHNVLPKNHKELTERDTATLVELIDRHFPYAELNAKFVRETAESLAWMHDDKSLGLALGTRFHIEGIAALRKQRDQLQKENDILRGLLPRMAGAKCPHCGLEDIAQCKSGFPGCGWADDLMCGEEAHTRHLLTALGEQKGLLKQANDIISNQQGEARWMQERIEKLETELKALSAPGEQVDRTGEALGGL